MTSVETETLSLKIDKALKERYDNAGTLSKKNILDSLRYTFEIAVALYTPESTGKFTKWLSDNKQVLKDSKVYQTATPLSYSLIEDNKNTSNSSPESKKIPYYDENSSDMSWQKYLNYSDESTEEDDNAT